MDELFSRIDKTDSCWIWLGGKTTNGYGTVRYKGKTNYIHRLVYTLVKGPIPIGLQIDHLCRVRLCCNPDHLEAVTQRENLLRGNTITAKNVAKTECPKGHLYNETNTIHRDGNRICRECKRLRDADYHKRNPKVSKTGKVHPGLRTHCPQGHEYTKENTYVKMLPNDKRGRACRTCQRMRDRARRCMP